MLRNIVRLSVAVIVIALAVSLRPASPALALVHVAEISEVMVGLDGDPDVQFVEINMRQALQHYTDGAHLASFDASGTFIDADGGTLGDQPNITFVGDLTSNAADGARWIIGTSEFATASGITPDFILPTSPGLPATAGMVCLFEPIKDFTDPSKSIDCVAYGGVSFTGTNPNWTSDGSAHPSGPGDGSMSLTRTTPATTISSQQPHARSEDSSAFSLVCPTPENNAGDIGSLSADGDNDGLPDCNENELGTDVADPDTDDDGCLDGVEQLGDDELVGGLRDPLNPWDFYDVAIAGAIKGQDKQIDLFNDIVSVIDHYAPTGLEPEYDVWYDRGPSAGPHPWNLTAPDGKIDLFNDIVGVINQFGHDCR